jgi:hypothetical protein
MKRKCETMKKYNEIFKLKKMLEDADIPFTWVPHWGYENSELERLRKITPDLMEHYQIEYPCGGDLRVCSVIEGFGTYGNEADLLEIMGLLTSEERRDDIVLGGLSADDVFKRIKDHYLKNIEKEICLMKKTIKVVDEETLQMKEITVEEEEEEILSGEKVPDEIINDYRAALSCEPEEFYQKYRAYKKAEAEFNEIYEPFKENLIKLYEKRPGLPKSVIISGAKLTYVSPSTRSSIDSKKLKEEEPEIAKKFTKISNVKATIRLEDM